MDKETNKQNGKKMVRRMEIKGNIKIKVTDKGIA